MDPTTVEVVPGDELEYTGSYTIDAEGENLQATVGVTGGAATGTLADDITRTVAAEIDGDVVTSVTDENDGAALDVVVSVDFPFDESLETPTADNLSQSSTLDLASVAVTLTQTDATE